MDRERRRRVHQNLIDASRRFYELDPGARVEDAAGVLLAAGSHPHPAITNAAFRRDDDLDPAVVLRSAEEFFSPSAVGFSIWTRTGDEDRDLVAAATAAGFTSIYRTPEMVLEARPTAERLPAGVELHRVESAADADRFWHVARSSYADLGFPPEVFDQYTRPEGLWADGVVSFVARLDGEPAAIAMTVVSEAVAGIYWVGTLGEARGRGLARALTLAAIEAGFELGADLASLQASAMGEPVYAALGFETIGEYDLLIASPGR